MQKKYLVGSIFVVLLMLVSTQLVFLKTVKSDPTIHYGDAEVGEFWISELDVSDVLQEVNYVGVAHVSASDDWVCWDEGIGNVTAEWEVNVASEQNPEYIISYYLAIYNIDNGSKCIGSDEFSTICSAETGYNLSGTLQVEIKFSSEEMEQGSATLVCWLDTTAYINNTEEAKNFMSATQDRCIVAVDFEWPQSEPPFSGYRDEANEKMPSPWFWQLDWENNFADEDEMMAEQTILIGGSEGDNYGSSASNSPWDLGDIYIDYMDEPAEITITAGDDHVDWYRNLPVFGEKNGVWGPGKVDFDIDTWVEPGYPFHKMILMYWKLKRGDGVTVGHAYKPWIYLGQWSCSGQIRRPIISTATGPGEIYMTTAKIGAWIVGGGVWEELDLSNQVYINILDDGSGESIPDETWKWDDYCASMNISASLNQGVLKGNIADLLQTDYNCVYTYKGDRGETTIELFCQSE